MKKLLKVLGILVLSMLVILILIIAYIKIALPNVGPAPDMKVEYSVARLNRGKYLANHVMVCMDCHSIRNPSLFSMPMDESTRGGGGQRLIRVRVFPAFSIQPTLLLLALAAGPMEKSTGPSPLEFGKMANPFFR